MRLIIAVLIIIFLFLQYKLWFAHHSVAELIRLRAEIAMQASDNKRLQEQNRALEAEVRDLKSGHVAIEERARSELGMVRNGETFYQIVEPRGTEQP
jgi:cell division protein FtsB